MSLTPADIHNIAFRKGPIGKRGYDEQQVDGFLDELEHELIRLIEENNELRTLLERGGVSAGAGADQVLAADLGHTTAQLNRVQREKAAADQAARAMRAELERVRARVSPVVGDDGEQALRVLAMAQSTADNHVRDARREAQSLLSDAISAAKQVTDEARAEADAVERSARQRHQEAMGRLDSRSGAAQRHIEELEAFEREYRSRLKAHLESQVRDLDGRGPGLEAEKTREDS